MRQHIGRTKARRAVGKGLKDIVSKQGLGIRDLGFSGACKTPVYQQGGVSVAVCTDLAGREKDSQR